MHLREKAAWCKSNGWLFFKPLILVPKTSL
jgi:hypothetical protein